MEIQVKNDTFDMKKLHKKSTSMDNILIEDKEKKNEEKEEHKKGIWLRLPTNEYEEPDEKEKIKVVKKRPRGDWGCLNEEEDEEVMKQFQATEFVVGYRKLPKSMQDF